MLPSDLEKGCNGNRRIVGAVVHAAISFIAAMPFQADFFKGYRFVTLPGTVTDLAGQPSKFVSDGTRDALAGNMGLLRPTMTDLGTGETEIEVASAFEAEAATEQHAAQA